MATHRHTTASGFLCIGFLNFQRTFALSSQLNVYGTETNGSILLGRNQNTSWNYAQLSFAENYYIPCGDCYPTGNLALQAKNQSAAHLFSQGSSQNTVKATMGENIKTMTMLHQNTPNPFSQTTTISFDLAEDSNLKLTVHNAIGQEILVLADGRFTKGTHTIPLNANSLISGIYTYRLQMPHTTLTNKMILMR